MSFVEAVVTIMADSVLSEVMLDMFSRISKIQSGKKLSQNIGALCLVAEEILRIRPIFDIYEPISSNKFTCALDELAFNSKASKLWVDSLIKPVFIMMMYMWAERGGNLPFHIEAVHRCCLIFLQFIIKIMPGTVYST